MNNFTSNKNVNISGKNVIIDWRNSKVVAPENFLKKIKANDIARQEIKNQRRVMPTTTNIISTNI
ncbi:MAG: hypothetical protein ABIH48_00525 [Candidatus Falkowbacteria bacterium]